MKRLCLLSLIAFLSWCEIRRASPARLRALDPATCNAMRKHLPRTLPRIRIISP